VKWTLVRLLPSRKLLSLSNRIMSNSRPFGVTLFLWMVLSLSVWGAIRLFAALRWWGVLYEFDARLSPLYLSITGAGWVLAGIFLLWSLWTRRTWTYWAVPASIGLWFVEYWIERLFFQAPRANLPFALIASALLLTITISLTRTTKNFFTKSEEHEQPNEDTTSA
jgi:hypothetical protein